MSIPHNVKLIICLMIMVYTVSSCNIFDPIDIMNVCNKKLTAIVNVDHLSTDVFMVFTDNREQPRLAGKGENGVLKLRFRNPNSAIEILEKDIRYSLFRSGINAVDKPQGALLPLFQIQISLIKASAQLGLLGSEYGIIGSFVFIVRIVDPNKNILWSKKYIGKSFQDNLLFSSSRVQIAINKAYCNAIEKLNISSQLLKHWN